MKRTNVYADPADLEMIKAAAARRGVPEAEILREGIHLAALGARVWPEPLVSPEQTVDLGGPARRDDIRAATAASAATVAGHTAGCEQQARDQDPRN